MTVALYHWRTIQIGFRFFELFHVTMGEVLDIITESENDKEIYDQVANQNDIDTFFD